MLPLLHTVKSWLICPFVHGNGSISHLLLVSVIDLILMHTLTGQVKVTQDMLSTAEGPK